MGKQAGKTRHKRVMFCHKCEARHSAPTGAKCVRQPEDDPPSSVVSEDMHTDEEAPGSPKAGNTSNTVNKNAPSKLTDTQLILQKMAEFKADITQQRLADKAEMKAEIQTLTAKIEAPILSSEDEEPEQPKAQGKTAMRLPTSAFAKPARQAPSLFGTWVTADTLRNAVDPIARLREDGATAAQAQAILGASGVSLNDFEGINVNSGFYRTMHDTKLFDVPWLNDSVYRNSGKKATFDSMSIPEFVAGYCKIVIASLPDVKVTADHVGYLADVMSDIEGGQWELVRNSHRQVLHQIEQGQLVWEDVAARDSFRSKYLQRAERAAGLGKSFKNNNMGGGGAADVMPRGLACGPFQSNRCVFSSHHQSNGQNWVHMCATCQRVTGQKNPHPECECKRKLAHDRQIRQPQYGTRGNQEA